MPLPRETSAVVHFLLSSVGWEGSWHSGFHGFSKSLKLLYKSSSTMTGYLQNSIISQEEGSFQYLYLWIKSNISQGGKHHIVSEEKLRMWFSRSVFWWTPKQNNDMKSGFLNHWKTTLEMFRLETWKLFGKDLEPNSFWGLLSIISPWRW